MGNASEQKNASPAYLTRGLLGLIRFYRFFISCLLGPVCRFEPSCSTYALQAVEVHGGAKGIKLAIKRVLRCHPWHPGGIDAVPERVSTMKSVGQLKPEK